LISGKFSSQLLNLIFIQIIKKTKSTTILPQQFYPCEIIKNANHFLIFKYCQHFDAFLASCEK